MNRTQFLVKMIVLPGRRRQFTLHELESAAVGRNQPEALEGVQRDLL